VHGSAGRRTASRSRHRFRNGRAPITAVAIVAIAASAHAIDQPKFESLHRAAKAMEAAATGDVSYERLSELARTFAEELVATKDHAQTDEERALLMLYAQAGLAYGDSLAFLGQRIRYERPDVPSQAPEIAPLVTRYAISTKGDEVDVNSAVAVIWAAADEALRKAELLYAGHEDELAAVMGAESTAQEHQRELIDRVATEFDREEHAPSRPRPYEAGAGNWTCPRGYLVHRGACLSDDEVARLPKVEVSE
jgi:hypothetical protein